MESSTTTTKKTTVNPEKETIKKTGILLTKLRNVNKNF